MNMIKKKSYFIKLILLIGSCTGYEKKSCDGKKKFCNENLRILFYRILVYNSFNITDNFLECY